MQAQSMDEHPLMGPGRGRLLGKVALVTGADSGIGRASARLMAREGARVVCADIAESAEVRIDERIGLDGGEALFVQADVSTRAGCDEAVAAAIERFGDLHILHNNIGVSVRGRIDELTDDEWNGVVNVNLNSVYHGTRAVLPHFMANGRGNIVSTASTHGILADLRSPAYCATKAAIVNLTRQLALDYGPAIRVNCVCPGPTETPRYVRNMDASGDPEGYRIARSARVAGLKRLARAEEIAYAILFLVSDESSYVSGHALVVDGGQTVDV